MFYIISYDIPDDKRRLKLSKSLLDFGNRVQYSVFEANLDNLLFTKMLKRIKKIIDEHEDSVRIYKLCATCEKDIQLLGIGEILKEKGVYII